MIVRSCDGMERDELLEVVVKVTRKVAAGKRKRRKLTNANWHLKSGHAALQARVEALEAERESVKFIMEGDRVARWRRSKRGRAEAVRWSMTTAGRYRLGIKRCFGSAGAVSTLAMLEVPVSRQTVYRSERLHRSNVWSRSKTWYEANYASLDSVCKDLARRLVKADWEAY